MFKSPAAKLKQATVWKNTGVPNLKGSSPHLKYDSPFKVKRGYATQLEEDCHHRSDGQPRRYCRGKVGISFSSNERKGNYSPWDLFPRLSNLSHVITTFSLSFV